MVLYRRRASLGEELADALAFDENELEQALDALGTEELLAQLDPDLETAAAEERAVEVDAAEGLPADSLIEDGISTEEDNTPVAETTSSVGELSEALEFDEEELDKALDDLIEEEELGQLDAVLGDSTDEPVEQVEPQTPAAAEEPSTDIVAEASPEPIEAADDLDAEILEIFIDEADELLEQIEGAIDSWSAAGGREGAEELKRALHTLKGGARLAGLMGLGELAHEYETFVIKHENDPVLDAAFFGQLNQYQDRLLGSVEIVKAKAAGEEASGLDAVLDVPSENESDRVQESAGPVDAEGDDKPAVEGKAPDVPSADILPFCTKSKTGERHSVWQCAPVATG